MQEYKSCSSTYEKAPLVCNAILCWVSRESISRAHTGGTALMPCRTLRWDILTSMGFSPKWQQHHTQPGTELQASTAWGLFPFLRKSRKETGGGRIEVLFGIFQGFCSFRVKFQWILNIDNAQRYLSAWSKHVKTHEFWTNKESQILAEAPCLYSSHKRNDCERQ